MAYNANEKNSPKLMNAIFSQNQQPCLDSLMHSCRKQWIWMIVSGTPLLVITGSRDAPDQTEKLEV